MDDIVSLISLLFMPISIYLVFIFYVPVTAYMKTKRFKKLTEENVGEVESVKVINEAGNTEITVKHFVGGNLYSAPLYGAYVNDYNHEVGDKIKIIYDPKNPNFFIEEDKVEEVKQEAINDFKKILVFWSIVVAILTISTICLIIFS